MEKNEKSKKPKDKRTQSERFKDTAEELGADESGEAFERAFKKITPPVKRSSR